MGTQFYCRITDPEAFQPDYTDKKRGLYNELYHTQGYAFGVIAETLRAKEGQEIQAHVRARLQELIESNATPKPQVCSYLACADDGEVDVASLNESLLEKYGSFVLPVLEDTDSVEYVLVDTYSQICDLTFNDKLQIHQISTDAHKKVLKEEITHMLVPGIPVMTYEHIPEHTGWMLPRHPYGYDHIMKNARENKLDTTFIGVGVCPIFLAGTDLLRDVLDKPRVDYLVTPSETLYKSKWVPM